MSFWESISQTFRSFTNGWISTDDQQEEPAWKRTKLSDTVHSKSYYPSSSKSLSHPSTLQMTSNELPLKDRKRSLQPSDPIVLSTIPNHSNDLSRFQSRLSSQRKEPLNELILNMETGFSFQSFHEKKQMKLQWKQSILDIQQQTREHLERVEPEIQQLFQRIQQLDAANTILQDGRAMLEKIRTLLQPIGFRQIRQVRHRRHLAAAGYNLNQNYEEQDLRTTLWKTEQRAILIRHQLQIVLDLVYPEMVKLERNKFYLTNADLTIKIFQFLPWEALLSSHQTCSFWYQIIENSCLRSLSMPSPIIRSRYWDHCILQRRLLYASFNGSQFPMYAQCLDRWATIYSSSPFHQTAEMEQIYRDVRRTTFDSIGSYNIPLNLSTEEKQERLTRLLTMYCRVDPSIGYCQGMTHVGAMILVGQHFDEEKSFHTFLALMEVYEMKLIFQSGLTGTIMRFYQLESLVHQYFPSISIQMKRFEVAPIMFASGWIMTLFTNESNLPFELQIMILDSFWAKGWIQLFSIILSIFYITQNELIQSMSMDQFLYWLTKGWKHKFQISTFFQLSKRFEIREEQLKALEHQFYQQHKQPSVNTWGFT